MREIKKPIYKKWWFWTIVIFIMIGIIGSVTDGENADKQKDDSQNNEIEDNASSEVANSNENNDEGITWDDLKGLDMIVGKSDKDFKELTKSKPNKVRNDETGEWKKSTFSENEDIEEYLLSYVDLYMEEGDTHFIINFNYETTTVVNYMNSLIYADVREHVKREEHDADTIGSGTLLKSYVIYPDGDIQELKE